MGETSQHSFNINIFSITHRYPTTLITPQTLHLANVSEAGKPHPAGPVRMAADDRTCKHVPYVNSPEYQPIAKYIRNKVDGYLKTIKAK